MIKLRLSELGLYGRDEELAALKTCYKVIENCGDNDGDKTTETAPFAVSSNIVVVSGAAGSGKSALVKKFSKELLCGTKEPLFVSGKFDDPRETTGQPYAALRRASGQLTQDIAEFCEESDRKEMGERINKALGPHGVNVLERVVPGVRDLVETSDEFVEDDTVAGSVMSVSDVNRQSSAEALNRLKFALRSFLRSVSSPSRPVVLFLDDLQWADQASIQMIRSIITDTHLKHFMFIGAHREEEVGEDHPLAAMLSDVEKEAKSSNAITRIELQNLDSPTVAKLLSGLLRLEASEVGDLSDVVHKRTGGNAFFVIQFLDMLQDRELLYYGLTTYKWAWDIERIRAETDISDNVVEFVARKIERLSAQVIAVLKLMACFPSGQVDVTFLESILNGLNMEEFRDARSEDSSLISVLDQAVDEGLLDRIGSDSYRFTHDRIREGAYSLIPEGKECDTFHLRIGELVLGMLASNSEQQWMKFVAADQLNHGVEYITDRQLKLDLALLNLEAGELAMSTSAFVPAAKFFNHGLAILSDKGDHWEKHYDLSLELHNNAAETAFCNGDFELNERMVNEVLSNGRSVRDKLFVHCVFLESLTAQQKLDKAMALGYQVLAELGQRFPKRFLLLHVLSDFQKTKKMLRGYSDDDIVALPPMEDETVIVTIRLLVHLARCAFFLHRLESMVLLVFREIQLMLRYGASGDTPYSFAFYGMLLCGGLGSIQEGCRYGRLSLRLLERYNDKETQVLLLAHSFVIHWQSPVQDQIDPLLRAHQVGMASGDVINAFLAAVGYIYFFYHAGLPLKTLEKDTSAYCRQMQEYKQELTYMEILPLWQGILNLMGRSKDPLVLTGEAIDQEEFLRDAESRCIPQAVQKVYLVRLQLAFYFGDIDLASEMLEECEKRMSTLTAHMVYEVYTFFCGLVYLELARRTKKRKYKKKAHLVIKKMEKWVSDRGVNCVHKLWLLEAEYAGLGAVKDGEKNKIMSAYDSSISTASRAGFLHDAAVANERAGVWFQGLGDEFWASSYLSRAHELYREWGAEAKADQLNRKHKLGFPSSSQEVVGSGHFNKGKARFDRRSSQRHKSVVLAELSTTSLGSDMGSDRNLLAPFAHGSERNLLRTSVRSESSKSINTSGS